MEFLSEYNNTGRRAWKVMAYNMVRLPHSVNSSVYMHVVMLQDAVPYPWDRVRRCTPGVSCPTPCRRATGYYCRIAIWVSTTWMNSSMSYVTLCFPLIGPHLLYSKAHRTTTVMKLTRVNYFMLISLTG